MQNGPPRGARRAWVPSVALRLSTPLGTSAWLGGYRGPRAAGEPAGERRGAWYIGA